MTEAWPPAGPLILSQQVLEDGIIQHLLGQQFLQTGILRFQRVQRAGITHMHPAELRLPFVESPLADPVIPANLSGRQPARLLRQDRNDLFLGKAALPHRPSPLRRTHLSISGPSGEQLNGRFSCSVATITAASWRQDAAQEGHPHQHIRSRSVVV